MCIIPCPWNHWAVGPRCPQIIGPGQLVIYTSSLIPLPSDRLITRACFSSVWIMWTFSFSSPHTPKNHSKFVSPFPWKRSKKKKKVRWTQIKLDIYACSTTTWLTTGTENFVKLKDDQQKERKREVKIGNNVYASMQRLSKAKYISKPWPIGHACHTSYIDG